MKCYMPVLVKFATYRDAKGKERMKVYKGDQCISNCIRYIFGESEGKQLTDVKLIGGYGVCTYDSQKAIRDFKRLQRSVRKEDGRRMYHIIISFLPDKMKKADLAYEIVEKICDKFLKGTQYLYGVHTDTGSLHAHVCINSVKITKKHNKIHFNKKEGRELLENMVIYGTEVLMNYEWI